MDFALTSDQEALRSSVREFLESEGSLAIARKVYGGAEPDSGLWKKAAEMGWTGLVVPEALGGAGLGWLEAALVAEQNGRFLFPGPFISTQVAVAALTFAGRTDWIAKIADGSVVPAIAIYEGRSMHRKDVNIKARAASDGFVIDGTKLFVGDGVIADIFLTAVRLEDGWGIAIVPKSAQGTEVSGLPVIDKTRPQASVTFREVSIPEEDMIRDERGLIIDRLRDRACILIAAEQAGVSRKCLELSTEYAKTRIQFDKPIGTYQAVSHKLSDMFLATEHATSLSYFAAWSADQCTGDPDLTGPAHTGAAVAAWRAKLWASQAATRASADAIQVHGGIGFTWEHDLHMYFKRAHSNEILFDEPGQLLDLVFDWGLRQK